MNRGADRMDIFCDDRDRGTFLDCVEESARQAAVEVHAWCLMSSHFHLLVHSREGRLSEFLRLAAGRYSRAFNRRWERDGPIFRARTQTVEIGSDAQLVETSRYIHLNPVRAGLVAAPADWPWSSAGAYLRHRSTEPWLVTKTLLEMFEGSGRGIDYASFLADGVDAARAQVHGEGK